LNSGESILLAADERLEAKEETRMKLPLKPAKAGDSNDTCTIVLQATISLAFGEA
jgi:hypothetical protein